MTSQTSWESEFFELVIRSHAPYSKVCVFVERLLIAQRKSLREEIVQQCFATVELWRPWFYRDNITKEDQKELKKMFHALLKEMK